MSRYFQYLLHVNVIINAKSQQISCIHNARAHTHTPLYMDIWINMWIHTHMKCYRMRTHAWEPKMEQSNYLYPHVHMCTYGHSQYIRSLPPPRPLCVPLTHAHLCQRAGMVIRYCFVSFPVLIIKCWSTDAWVYFGFLSFCLDFFLIRLFHWYLSGSIMWLIDLLFHLFSIPFFHFRCWALIAVMCSAPVHWTPEPVRCCMLHWL